MSDSNEYHLDGGGDDVYFLPDGTKVVVEFKRGQWRQSDLDYLAVERLSDHPFTVVQVPHHGRTWRQVTSVDGPPPSVDGPPPGGPTAPPIAASSPAEDNGNIAIRPEPATSSTNTGSPRVVVTTNYDALLSYATLEAKAVVRSAAGEVVVTWLDSVASFIPKSIREPFFGDLREDMKQRLAEGWSPTRVRWMAISQVTILIGRWLSSSGLLRAFRGGS